MKKVRVPIVNDDQYTADKDFYVFLKNPSANASCGDPSVTRITIIDDDGDVTAFLLLSCNLRLNTMTWFRVTEPGQVEFEKPHYYANIKTGTVTVKIVRNHGSDGDIEIEYTTM